MSLSLALRADEFVRRVSSGQFFLELHADGVYLVYAATRERARLLASENAHSDGTPPEATGWAEPTLSDRERQVLDLLGAGVDMQGISARLGLSVKTIETYRARIKQKFGLTNRTQLLTLAVERRLRHADGSHADARTESFVS
jgi:DNA-binding NarL/FixJ family response regulator